MAFDPTWVKSNTLKHLINAESNNNVVFEVSNKPYIQTDEFRLKCTNCGATFSWTAINYIHPLGIEPQIVVDFCKDHKHIIINYPSGIAQYEEGQSITTPLNGDTQYVAWTKEVGPTYKTFVTNSTTPIEPAKVSIKDIGQYADYTKYADFITSSDLDAVEPLLGGGVFNTSLGGYKEESVRIPEVQLKKIWQWSNFMVDLQIRVYNGAVNKVRLFCNECKQEQEVIWFKVKNPADPIWKGIEEYCRKHVDCGTRTFTEARGRKFKDA
jgi:hypothetical protein